MEVPDVPPKLVICSCDPDWTALAVCPTCERRQLHDLLVRRNAVADPVRAAFDALAKSYYLDAADDTDRDFDRSEGLEDYWKQGWH